MDEVEKSNTSSTSINPRVGRRQYLVTYSQADATKFSTRESFAKMLEEEFNAGSSAVKVEYWACCSEKHQNNGFHYHCALKLTGCKKWLSIKTRIVEKHGIQVNFSDNHNFYLSAYRYVCKSDKDVAHSENHPTGLLRTHSPKTKNSIAGFRAACATKRKSSVGECSHHRAVKKRKSLNNLDLSEFIRERGIKSYTELLAIAEERRTAGQMDIAEFVFKRSEKILHELITKTWQMESAKEKIKVSKLSRIDTVKNHLKSDCAEGCSGQWLQCAKEVLLLNRIDLLQFITSIKDLLIHGRGKNRNLIITGPANCAKTFMFKPLQLIFHDSIFENPANDKYAWVGSEKAKVFLLNDFRWSKDLIPWHDMLLLLEGETVKLPAPKNIYSEDVVITTNVAIFATSKSPIKHKGPYNASDDRETEMMAARWKNYEFHHQFSPQEQKCLSPCPRCFADLLFSN